MMCPRCGGLMRQEQFYDHFEIALHADFAGWHCINCGEILDRVILAHRCQRTYADPVSATQERRMCHGLVTGQLTT